jgi:hypothetical protein
MKNLTQRCKEAKGAKFDLILSLPFFAASEPLR